MRRLIPVLALMLLAIPARLWAGDDLLARMSAVDPALHSYSAVMHAHVTLTTFPFLSADLTGTYFHKDPDFDKLEITSGLPMLAQGFSKLYAHVEPPSLWGRYYTIRARSDDGKVTSFTLVPRAAGNVASLLVRVDDASATIRSIRWSYANGGWARVQDRYGVIQGDTVITSQNGHVEEPNYKGDITATLSGYRLNPPLPDSLFTQ